MYFIVFSRYYRVIAGFRGQAAERRRMRLPYDLVLCLCLCLFTSTGLYAEALLHPTQGKPIPFSQLQGKWVLINYWASWCEPCLAEIPELNQLYEHSNKKKLALFAVNYDMQPAEMQQQLAVDNHIHYPALREDPANALHLGDIRGVPVTFIFNPKGILIETLFGGQTAAGLKKRLVPR